MKMTGPHQRHCLQICLRRALRDSQDMKTLEKEKRYVMTYIKKQAVETTNVYKPI